MNAQNKLNATICSHCTHLTKIKSEQNKYIKKQTLHIPMHQKNTMMQMPKVAASDAHRHS